MESSVYRMGQRDGEERGEQRGEQKVLAKLFEKRLGRALADDERGVLVRKLGSLGYDRLVDVRDTLSPEALAAWLGDPAAT